MRKILRLDQSFKSKLSITYLKSNYVPQILDFCPFSPYFFQKSHCSRPHHIPFKNIKMKENAWKKFYVTNPFQAFQYQSNIQFYNQHSLFCLVFLNSSLPSILYSQLGKQCICTHKMQFCLLGVSPKPSETIRNLIELRLTGCINSILANEWLMFCPRS